MRIYNVFFSIFLMFTIFINILSLRYMDTVWSKDINVTLCSSHDIMQNVQCDDIREHSADAMHCKCK